MKKTLTIMALLAALGAVPQGVAQTGTIDDPISGIQTERWIIPGEGSYVIDGGVLYCDLYAQGTVRYEGMVNSTFEGGGAPITIRDGLGGYMSIISLSGKSDERVDQMIFRDNVLESDFYSGAVIGTESTTAPFILLVQHFDKFIFERNRMVVNNSNQPCGGGSVGIANVIWQDIGTLGFTGSYDGITTDPNAIDQEEVAATFGGAINTQCLRVLGVDDFYVQYILTADNYLGGSAIDIGGGDDSIITGCGRVDFSHNATIYKTVDYYLPAGSTLEVYRTNFHCHENGQISITNNYAINSATVRFYSDNYPYDGKGYGYFTFFLNGDINFLDNRAGYGHAGIEVFLMDLEVDGLLSMSADNGNITFKGNIGGVDQEKYAQEAATNPDGGSGVIPNRMQNVATSIVFRGLVDASQAEAGDFRALENRTINFLDPMRVDLQRVGDYGVNSEGSLCQVIKLKFNKTPDVTDDSRLDYVVDAYVNSEYGKVPDEYSGTIRFSGEEYREIDHSAQSYLQQWESESDYEFARRLLRSRWSTVLAQSTVWGGEFLIENGAIYGDGEEDWVTTKSDGSEELVNEKFLNFKLSADEAGYKLGQGGKDLTIAMEPDGDSWQFAEDTSLDIQKGALAIRTDGIVIAKNISFSGHDAMLRMDDTARIIADRVDLTKGVSVDFNHALEHGVKIAMLSDAGTKSHQLVHAKLTVTANSLDMGTTFTLGVPDHTTATPGEFYSGEAWKGDLTFAVLDLSHVLDKGGVASGDNLSIVSVASVSADTGEGTNLVAYEGGSQGEWSIHWGEGDDDQYVLYAEWKNTDPDEPDEPDEPGTGDTDDPGTGDAEEPGTGDADEPGTGDADEPGTGDADEPGTGDADEPGTGDADEPGDGGSTPAVDPGRVGVAVENSLWSTKGNAEQLQRAALAQVTAFRFMDHRATRLWGSVLGEYDRVHGSAGADGYEYSGEGYAVGMDRVWKNRYLLGAGFGQMFGKNRGRSLPDVIEQDSVMATVYGAAVQKLSDRDSLTYEGSLTLGWTDNEMSSWQSAVSPAHGDWDSKALLLKGDVIWSRRLSERSVLGLTAGLEFGRAWREGFTETGIGERRFDRSSLTVLSMPIGCSWTHESGIGGKPWVNTLYVAYVPDLYREDPKSAARDGVQTWEVRGSAPGRHALQVGYGTQWAVSESCTIYAGYSFEYRETAAYHNLNAGVSVGF